MARYLITRPYQSRDTGVIKASRDAPRPLVVADEQIPSRHWVPLDKAAQKALEKLGIKREIVGAPEPEKKPTAPAPQTLGEAGGTRGRASDKSPI